VRDLASEVPLPAVALLSTLGSIIPIILGLILAKASSARKEIFYPYAPALSLGIILSTFYDLLHETAGLQVGSFNPVPQAVALILFLIGLLAWRSGSTQTHGHEATVLASSLAYAWALGIGVHGLGEGVVIGYGFIHGIEALIDPAQILSYGLHKLGEAFTLGTLLVLATQRPRSWIVAGLAASLPVGLGAIAGFTKVPAELSTYSFALGAGIAAYFLVQFARLLPSGRKNVYYAVAAGFLFMYFAGLLHQF